MKDRLTKFEKQLRDYNNYIPEVRMNDKEKLEIAVQALKDIIDPIGEIKRDICQGYVINLPTLIKLSESHIYLKEIAEMALRKIKEG